MVNHRHRSYGRHRTIDTSKRSHKATRASLGGKSSMICNHAAHPQTKAGRRFGLPKVKRLKHQMGQQAACQSSMRQVNTTIQGRKTFTTVGQLEVHPKYRFFFLFSVYIPQGIWGLSTATFRWLFLRYPRSLTRVCLAWQAERQTDSDRYPGRMALSFNVARILAGSSSLEQAVTGCVGW